VVCDDLLKPSVAAQRPSAPTAAAGCGPITKQLRDAFDGHRGLALGVRNGPPARDGSGSEPDGRAAGGRSVAPENYAH
jgi:hypothetical protein